MFSTGSFDLSGNFNINTNKFLGVGNISVKGGIGANLPEGGYGGGGGRAAIYYNQSTFTGMDRTSEKQTLMLMENFYSVIRLLHLENSAYARPLRGKNTLVLQTIVKQ